MAFPLIPLIAGASTVVGGHLTRHTIASGMRSGLSQFGQALPFGAGYSFGTYVGFPKNYAKSAKFNTSQSFTFDEDKLPYGRYYPRRYSRYNRYSRFGSRRRYRRSYRSYRRYY